MLFKRSFLSIWQRVRESSSTEPRADQHSAGASPFGSPIHAAFDVADVNADSEYGWNSSVVASPPDDDTDPAHDVLKKTDVWFALKIAGLEKEARELAALHAEKGQPRHDLPRSGRLELEIVLEQHAREVLWGWMDRVQRKMQGAVETAMDSIGTGLVAARAALVTAASARTALDLHVRDTGRKVPAIRLFPGGKLLDEPSAVNTEHSHQRSEEIEVERHLGSWGFWPLMILLIIADFFANLPVFVELFPANHVLDEAFSAWEEEAVSSGLSSWFGIFHLVKRAAVYPEPSILAVVVVLLLLFLGHTIGSHLRTLVALARHRRGDISRSTSHTWRQSAWPAALSVLGAVLVVGVLALARDQVLPAADVRVQEARQALNTARADQQNEVGRDASPQAVVAATQRVADAVSTLTQREERQSYARAIDSMNLPIAGLNVVLIIAAMVVGYLRERKRFSVPQEGIIAQAEEYRARTDELRKEFESRLAAAQGAIRNVRTSISRAEHLLRSSLLRDWYGKAERAGRCISIFRIENARLRGLDVEDILAFRTPAGMALPTPDEIGVSLERPLVLDSYRDEFASLQGSLHDLEWNHVHTGVNDSVAAD